MADGEHPLLPDGYEERRALEDISDEEAADRGVDPAAVGFPDGAGEPMVWLAQPAEDLRRNHGMVVLARGEQASAFEIQGWVEEKPIDRLLSLAGYAPAKPSRMAPRLVDVNEQSFVPVMGFRAPPGTLGSITMRIAQAMSGELGGFSLLTLGQLGFHQAHAAFMAAWQAAGRPPMHVRQPQWVDPGAGSGAPLPLADALEKHIGHGSSLAYWDGQDLFEDEPVPEVPDETG